MNTPSFALLPPSASATPVRVNSLVQKAPAPHPELHYEEAQINLAQGGKTKAGEIKHPDLIPGVGNLHLRKTMRVREAVHIGAIFSSTLLALRQTLSLMKSFRLAFFILLTALHIPVTASDIQSRGTTMTGIVTSIDHSTRSVTFEQSHGKEIRRFVYARRAKFWHGDADTSPRSLRAGMHVQIDLRNPVFGPYFVTQIVLLVPAPSAVEKANK